MAGLGEHPKSLSINYRGTENVEGESLSYEQRKGRCYELAGFAFATGNFPEGSLLVHGTIDGGPGMLGRIGHAWVRIRTENIRHRVSRSLLWEPILAEEFDAESWVYWARAKAERYYSLAAARALMIDTSHYGPWHESRYR